LSVIKKIIAQYNSIIQWLFAFLKIVNVNINGARVNSPGSECINMNRITTIFIAGDSTAAVKLPEKRPETGWGEPFEHYLKSNAVLDNRAINGRSTKSFLKQGHLASIESKIRPGDYLIIQFGHNDQKIEDPERGTSPYGDYQENLLEYVDAARRNHAHPVLFTPVTRRKYEGSTIDPLSVGDFPEAMKQFAEKNQVPLLDIHKATRDFFNSMGHRESASYFLHLAPGESPNYPDGLEDNTHFNEKGAEAVAHLIAEKIKGSDLPLKNLLK
jgi:lysophospholipase L1-like esterase